MSLAPAQLVGIGSLFEHIRRKSSVGGLDCFGVEIEAEVVAVCRLGGDESGAAAAEGIEDELTGLGRELDQRAE